MKKVINNLLKKLQKKLVYIVVAVVAVVVIIIIVLLVRSFAGGGAKRFAVVETKKGSFKIELYADKAPGTVANFKELVSKGFYNGLKFHRYATGFVIQGGDPEGNGTGGFCVAKEEYEKNKDKYPDSDFRKWNEILVKTKDGKRESKYCRQINREVEGGLKHETGSVAMARGNQPDSASSQFYIVLDAAKATHLNGDYAVFGKVVEGMDVVNSLQRDDVMEKVRLE